MIASDGVAWGEYEDLLSFIVDKIPGSVRLQRSGIMGRMGVLLRLITLLPEDDALKLVHEARRNVESLLEGGA